jgi:polysaccharide biosynthesis transport protein
MDGLQRYTAPAHASAVPSLPPDPASVKTPSDYVRALRRRVWLVLLVGVPLSVLSTIYVLRMPSVYEAEAMIFIEPPQYDPVLSTLLSKEMGPHDRESNDRYLPNRVAQLKSKALAERVINDPAFLQGGVPPSPEASDEFVKNLQTKTSINSNYVRVTLDGNDPARTAKQLFTLLDLFYKDARSESDTRNEDTGSYARASLEKVKTDLQRLDQDLTSMRSRLAFIGPGGKNMYQLQYESLGQTLQMKQARLGEAQHQSLLSQLFPHPSATNPDESDRHAQIADLQATRHKLTTRLQHYKRLVRNFNADPSVRDTSEKLADVMEELAQLKTMPTEAATDPSETIIASIREEIRLAEESTKQILGNLRESIPDHDRFLALVDERELMLRRKYDLQTKLSEFEMLAKSQRPPVVIPPSVAEPTIPIKPKRPIYIMIGVLLSLGLGVGLVCLFEHLDHSVKVPEHLTMGLTLPLLGVVPRIRRTALVHRAGHLWTPGDPASVEADAYRNLRASLLGASDRVGPIVTLLVTSAKAGEGKSTTALNLAATCARAGERTLLMDVDLRRPSLREVFHDEDSEPLGLVDVLRGELPWQRTVVRTDVPNLDFLPTGDTRETPIEILGTLELRQLLIALAGHYDRVILDGPAVLGLADCRMLGRVVDAAVLVVRSGTHEMRPLQRAKAMLEQSHVVIAGLVFNGLYDDLENWSSYGPDTPYGYGMNGYGHAAPRGRLGRAADEPAALPMTGSVDAA